MFFKIYLICIITFKYYSNASGLIANKKSSIYSSPRHIIKPPVVSRFSSSTITFQIHSRKGISPQANNTPTHCNENIMATKLNLFFKLDKPFFKYCTKEYKSPIGFQIAKKPFLFHIIWTAKRLIMKDSMKSLLNI